MEDRRRLEWRLPSSDRRDDREDLGLSLVVWQEQRARSGIDGRTSAHVAEGHGQGGIEFLCHGFSLRLYVRSGGRQSSGEGSQVSPICFRDYAKNALNVLSITYFIGGCFYHLIECCGRPQTSRRSARCPLAEGWRACRYQFAIMPRLAFASCASRADLKQRGRWRRAGVR